MNRLVRLAAVATLAAAVAKAQTNLITPVTIGPKTNLSASGELRLMSPDAVHYGDLTSSRLLFAIGASQFLSASGDSVSGGLLTLGDTSGNAYLTAAPTALTLGSASTYTALSGGSLVKMHTAGTDMVYLTASGVVGGRLQLFGPGPSLAVDLIGSNGGTGGQITVTDPFDGNQFIATGDALQVGGVSTYFNANSSLFKLHNGSFDQVLATSSSVLGGRLQIIDQTGTTVADINRTAIKFPALGGGGGSQVVCADNTGALSAGGCGGAGGTPGAPSTSVQFNCAGAFCGDSRFEYTAPNVKLTNAVLQFYSAPAVLDMQFNPTGTNQLQLQNSAGGLVESWNTNNTPTSILMVADLNITPTSCTSAACSTPLLQVGVPPTGQIGNSVTVLDSAGGFALGISASGRMLIAPTAVSPNPLITVVAPTGLTGDLLGLYTAGPTKQVWVDASGNLNANGLFLPALAGTGNRILQVNNAGLVGFASVSPSLCGADTQIQYNKSGSCGADSNLTWDYVNKHFFVTGEIIANGSAGGVQVYPRSGGGNYYEWYNPAGTDLRLWNGGVGGDLVTFTGSGLVGIDNNAPSFALHIGSNSYTGNAKAAFQVGGVGGAREWSIGTNYNGGTTAPPNFGFVIRDESAGHDVITIPWQNNFVGIGTDNPLTTLEVNGPILGDNVIATNGANGGFQMNPRSATGDAFVIYNPAGSAAKWWSQSHGDLLTLTNAGRLGINVASPQGDLDVNADIVARAYLRLYNSGSEQIHLVAFPGGAMQIQDVFNTRLMSFSNTGMTANPSLLVNPAAPQAGVLLSAFGQPGQTGPLFSLGIQFSTYFQVAASGAVTMASASGNMLTVDTLGNTVATGAITSGTGATNVAMNSSLIRGSSNGNTQFQLNTSSVIGGRLTIFNAANALTFDSLSINTNFLFTDSSGTTHTGNIINAGFFQMPAFSNPGSRYVCASSNGTLFISTSC